jgi:predicted RNA binding protein YcfA (HicA-like mRNA interferase family)
LSEGPHNWHQVVTVLEDLGFRQVSGYGNEILYFKHEKDERIIVFYKSNKMKHPYLLTILRRLGITYEEFVNRYSKLHGNTPNNPTL